MTGRETLKTDERWEERAIELRQWRMATAGIYIKESGYIEGNMCRRSRAIEIEHISNKER